ncbi:hypothetical protein Btru_051176 [Bulinus truncatus]|nr:hypothetical protein Btru_051176 [Bulinus truncatus]
MVPTLLFLVTSEIFTAGHAQSLPQLNFHFIATDPNEVALDVHLEEELDHILFGLMCKFSGNRFTARISPSQGATNLIDDSLGFTNDTEGAVPCLLSDRPEPVVCEESNFCELGNVCRASVKGVCRKHGDQNRWMMTQAVDVTLDQEDGQVVVTKCFTVCEPVDEEEKVKANGDGISYVTIIIIVVSVMIAPVLLVAAIVLYKLNDAKYLREIERKRLQFVQQASGRSHNASHNASFNGSLNGSHNTSLNGSYNIVCDSQA